MSDSFLAFRIFGDFVWPWAADGIDPLTVPPVRGVFEIHYRKVALGGAAFDACLRWVPWMAAAPEPPWTPLAADSVFAPLWAPGVDPATLFGTGDQPVCIALGGTAVPVAIRFAGVTAIDQFVADAMASDAEVYERPQLRLPILREQHRTGGQSTLSAFVLGGDGQRRWQLDLAVAAGRSVLRASAAATDPRPLLAWRASYDVRTTPDPATPVAALRDFIFGPRGHRGALTSQPREQWLGSFDFTRDVPGENGPWAQVRGADWPVMGDATDWFPALFGVTLQRRGARSAIKEVAWTPPDLPAFPSVRIEAAGGGFALIQRFAFVPGREDAIVEAGSDLRIRDGSFELRAAHGSDDWIWLGPRLIATLRLSGTPRDDQLLSDRSLRVGLQASIGFGDLVLAIDPETGLRVKTSIASSAIGLPHLLKQALAQARAIPAHLNGLEPTQPQSVVADLTLQGDPDLALYGAFQDRGGVLAADGALSVDPPGDVRFSLMAHDRLGALGAPRMALAASARWSSFLFGKTVTDRTTLDLLLGYRAARADDGDHLVGFGMVARGAAAPLAHITMGGLAFEGGGVLLDEEPSSLILGFGPDAATRATAWIWRFRFTDAQLVGPDAERGLAVGGAQALLFDEAPRPPSGYHVLVAREAHGGGEDRAFSAELLEHAMVERVPRGRIRFDTEPFAFQRIWSLPLGARGTQETVSVARYDGVTRRWDHRRTPGYYHYVHQAQSRGESMDKPGRLELHDALDVPKDAEYLAPLDVVQEQTDSDAGLGGLRRRAVEWRMTPPVDLWVDPSDVARAYLPAEAATRRVFGGRDLLGVGVRLAGLRAEFAYGLPVAIRPAREVGPAALARVAEIEALLGSVPGEPHRRKSTSSDRWSRERRAMAGRVERLELFAERPDSDRRFAPAAFRKPDFALRTTALHRPPLAALEGSAAATPVAGSPLAPRFHPLGLSGGVLWPIESANVLNLLLRNPVPSDGWIENVALSPLGGSADQTVRFANDRIAIVTETRDGLIQRQKVEVVGRIGALWNRAKHVIVYERTTAASAQFTPIDGSTATRRSRSRRPILRKVSEYVELLEPERRYPDSADGSVADSAFLQAVRFNSRIIPVDSAWSREVGTTGWEVPLWNRHAALQRPQVYVRPDICFVTASEGVDASFESPQECLNPDNLFFFADLTDGLTADSDLWPCRVQIDTSRFTPRAASDIGGDGPADLAGRGEGGREAPPVPQGLERFTWRLAPPAQRTQVNKGRGDQPIYAALGTITFMRLIGAEAVPEPPLRDAVRALKRQPLAPLLSWPDDGSLPSGVPPVDDLRAAIAAARASFGADLTDPVQQQAAREALAALQGSAETSIAALAPALVARKQALAEGLAALHQKVDDFKAEYPSKADAIDPTKRADQLCATLERDFLAGFRAKRAALLEQLARLRADILVAIDRATKVDDWLTDPAAIKAHLRERIIAAVRPVLVGTTATLGNARAGLAAAIDMLDDVAAGLDRGFDRARHELDAVRATIDQSKPWSPARETALMGQLDALFDRAHAGAVQAIADARSRLSAELDTASLAVAAAADQGLSQLAFAKGAVVAELARPPQLASRICGPFADRLAAQETTVGALGQRLRDFAAAHADQPDWVARATRVADLVDGLRARLVALRTLAEALPAQAEALARPITAAVQAAARQLKQGLADASAAATALLAAARVELDGLDKELIDQVENALAAVRAPVDAALDGLFVALRTADPAIDRWTDVSIAQLRGFVTALQTSVDDNVAPIRTAVEQAAGQVDGEIATIEAKLGAAALPGQIAEALAAGSGLDGLIDAIPAEAFTAIEALQPALRQAGESLFDKAEALVEDGGLAAGLDEARTALCDAAHKLAKPLDDFRRQIEASGAEILADWQQRATDWLGLDAAGIDGIVASAETFAVFQRRFDEVAADLKGAAAQFDQLRGKAEAYADTIARSVGDIFHGDVLGTPNRILGAIAAAGSPPELPNLDYARQRLNYYWGEAGRYINTGEIEAFFGRLGEALKAIGVSLPFNQLGGRIIPKDLSQFDIGRIFNNFGGLDFSKLFKGVKLPQGAKDAIILTHAFDKASYRAWVQLDVNLPIPGRSTLFHVGPFQLDMLNILLAGQVRLEASKDTAQVERSGHGSITADIDCVVGGQSMVILQAVVIRFGATGGLKVDFDPSRIKLNPNLEFIQKSLQALVPDQAGGVAIVKRDGVPVGIEHVFDMPPISLMGVTSGVQNVAISNRFRLLAYPDFLIANRFALSSPERPFIFSLFIVGGTGWIIVEVEYRPFQDELTVVVDAAVGGSASIGFGFAGCTGTMFITLSGVLTYRKQIGSPGGGLGISLLLLIAGVVDVLGIASAYLALSLRLRYRNNGGIEAEGQFSVKIRITRFFSVSAGGPARYQISSGSGSGSGSGGGGGGGGGGSGRSFSVDQARVDAAANLRAQRAQARQEAA